MNISRQNPLCKKSNFFFPSTSFLLESPSYCHGGNLILANSGVLIFSSRLCLSSGRGPLMRNLLLRSGQGWGQWHLLITASKILIEHLCCVRHELCTWSLFLSQISTDLHDYHPHFAHSTWRRKEIYPDYTPVRSRAEV